MAISDLTTPSGSEWQDFSNGSGNNIDASEINANYDQTITFLTNVITTLKGDGSSTGVAEKDQANTFSALQTFSDPGIEVNSITALGDNQDTIYTARGTGKLKYGGTTAVKEVANKEYVQAQIISGGEDFDDLTFTGATASTDGVAGMVPKPVIAERNKFLKADGTWASLDDEDTWEEKAIDFTAEDGGKYLLTADLDITMIDTPTVGNEFFVMAGDGFDISSTNIDLLQAASGEKIDGVDANGSLTIQVMYRIVYTGDATTGWRIIKSYAPEVTEYKSTSFSATATTTNHTRYMVDTNSGAITATLEATPSSGDKVEFVDFSSSFDTNNLTIDSNGAKIQGTPTDLVVSTANDNIVLQYQTNTGTTLTNDKYLAVGGTDEYVNCGNDSSIRITGAFSVSIWVNAASGPGTPMSRSGSSNGEYSWRFVDSSGKIEVWLAPSSDSTIYAKKYRTSIDVFDSTWHQVGFTYDGANNLKVYVDGVEDTSVVKVADTAMTTIYDCSLSLLIGASNSLSVRDFFTGSLDEIALWDSELSAIDMAKVYMGGAPIDLSAHPASGSLQAWWRCGDGDTYPTLTDSSSNSNDGTMTNMESGDLSSGAETGGTINDDTWVFIGNN